MATNKPVISLPLESTALRVIELSVVAANAFWIKPFVGALVNDRSSNPAAIVIADVTFNSPLMLGILKIGPVFCLTYRTTSYFCNNCSIETSSACAIALIPIF